MDLTQVYQNPPTPLSNHMLNDIQCVNYEFLRLAQRVLEYYPDTSCLFGFSRAELAALKYLDPETDLKLIASTPKLIFEPDISPFNTKKFTERLPNEYYLVVGSYSNIVRVLLSQYRYLVKIYLTSNEDIIHLLGEMNQLQLLEFIAEHQFRVRHAGSRYWINLFNAAIAENYDSVKLRLSSFNNLT